MRSFPSVRSFLPIVFSLPLLFTGCSKEPGEGGKALIRGTLYALEYNDNTGQPTGNEFYVPEYRVYIRYGDGEWPDEQSAKLYDDRIFPVASPAFAKAYPVSSVSDLSL